MMLIAFAHSRKQFLALFDTLTFKVCSYIMVSLQGLYDAPQ